MNRWVVLLLKIFCQLSHTCHVIGKILELIDRYCIFLKHVFFFFLRKCIVIPIQWLNIQPLVLSMQIYLLVLIATKSSNKAMLSRKRWKVVVTFIQNISNEVDDAIVHFEPATPRKHMRFSRHIIYNLPLKPCQINTLFPVSFL